MPQSRRPVHSPLWEHILCSSHMQHPLVSPSRPMGSVQLLMTPSASLPSPSTGMPIQRHLQRHHQPFSNSPFNPVSPSRPIGSIQLLMTTVQLLQPTLPHRFLLSPSTGRPVDCPLWEVPVPSTLMRWPLRSQYRCVDNLRSSTYPACHSAAASHRCYLALG